LALPFGRADGLAAMPPPSERGLGVQAFAELVKA
jgi:hypothetical protein